MSGVNQIGVGRQFRRGSQVESIHWPMQGLHVDVSGLKLAITARLLLGVLTAGLEEPT